mgnify:FL=1
MSENTKMDETVQENIQETVETAQEPLPEENAAKAEEAPAKE